VKKLLVVALSAMFLASSTPALAVTPTLPSGDRMFQMPCDSGATNDFQLFDLDLSSEDLVPVGNGSGVNGGNDCASQGAILPGTDWFYFIEWTGAVDTLVRVDVSTGEVDVIGAMRDEGSHASLYSLAIGPNGNAYALSYDYLYAVNLDTGDLVQLNEPAVYDLNEGYPYGFAYDPTTEHFYVVEDGGGELLRLNVSTGDMTSIATNDNHWVGSIAFDSDGYFWFNGIGANVRRSSLQTFGDNSSILATGNILLEGNPVFSESLGILRPEATDDDSEGLAPTGSTDVSALAALAGLAGLAAVAIRRRSTR
jgi:hypothetical protein